MRTTSASRRFVVHRRTSSGTSAIATTLPRCFHHGRLGALNPKRLG